MARAAEQARQVAANNVNPADHPRNDSVTPLPRPNGGIELPGPPDYRALARQYAAATRQVSSVTGMLALPARFIPVIGPAASAQLTRMSLEAGVANVLLTGYGYGWTSKEFMHSVGRLTLSTVGWPLAKKLGGDKVVKGASRLFKKLF
ncbi:hypothetical protein ABT263_02125 [Kitasatospora sp. NPDC001603]|uniref:hypothetical protein n=1 Tax=Kitasatospora sp. NPDC001603 TaxID=3154388 RepID=UPI003330F224